MMTIAMNKYHSTAFLVFSMLFLLNCSPQSEKSTALKELISAERAFAQLSAGTGMGTAFLTYLADDAIVFNPRPVKGKSRYLSVQDLPRRLIWEPYWADVSISGELGFTSGPWEFRQQRQGDSADTYGHYVSVWKKADDNWRVILDIGISHDFPGFLLEDSVSEVKKPDYLTVYHIGEAKNIAVTRFMLLEQVFSLTAQDSGINAAYRKYSAPE
ncbi:MAG: nuclear transport factor 2 family protein, partial [Calditrichaeota bacterium]